MPSLGIAPGSEGCAGQPNESDAEPAPVSGVFPVDVNLHLLEIGLQAIQLSPYHADLPAHRPQRLDPATGFLACSCPLHLSVPGQPSDPEIFLRIPPNSIGDTTGRLVAHFVRSTTHLRPTWIGAGVPRPAIWPRSPRSSRASRQGR